MQCDMVAACLRVTTCVVAGTLKSALPGHIQHRRNALARALTVHSTELYKQTEDAAHQTQSSIWQVACLLILNGVATASRQTFMTLYFYYPRGRTGLACCASTTTLRA